MQKKGLLKSTFGRLESLLLTSTFGDWNVIRQGKIWQGVCTRKIFTAHKRCEDIWVVTRYWRTLRDCSVLSEDPKSCLNSWDVLLSNESYIKPSLRKLKNRSSKDQLENNLDICQNKAHFSKMKDNKIQTIDIIKQCQTHYPKLLQFPKGRRMWFIWKQK